MNKLTRGLLSGASFVALAVGLPIAADANVVTGTGPGTSIGAGGSLTLNGTFDWLVIKGDRDGHVILNGEIDNGSCTGGAGTLCFGLAFYPGVTVSKSFVNNGTINIAGTYAGKQEVDAILVDGASIAGGMKLDGGAINMSIAGSPHQVAGIALENDNATNVNIDPGQININWHGNDGASVGTTGKGHILTCGEGFTGLDCVTANNETRVNPGVPKTTTVVNVPNPEGYFPISGEGHFPSGFPPENFAPANPFSPFSVQNQGGVNPIAHPVNDPNVFGVVDFYVANTHVLNISTNVNIGVTLTAAVQTLGVFGVSADRVGGGGGTQVSLNVNETAAQKIAVSGRVNAILGTVTVIGVNLDAESASAVNANVTNAGSIHAVAHAGTCTTLGLCWGLGQEDAHATGVNIRARNATSASVNVVNNGNIVATASVTGGSNFFWFGTGNHATAVGVHEIAFSATFATANLTNNVNGHIVANAFAHGTSVMTASAVAVLQSAALAGSGHLNLTNAGHITAFASASGSGFPGSAASIHAFATGVVQANFLVGSANNFLSNQAGGVISANAVAFVHNATIALASANAFGVVQFGLATSTNANNALVNGGTINVGAGAVATSASTAVALAHAFGVNQIAIAPSSAANSFGNSGVVNIGAGAAAGAVTSLAGGATVAVASAVVFDGINQVALAFSTAHNAFVNGPTAGGLGGTINIGAGALAVGSAVAVANAIIGGTVLGFSVAAIQQFALASTFASNTLTNNGNVNIKAVASAFAGTVAVADAIISHGAIGQAAIALNSTVGASAVNLMNNNGDVQVTASALAVGFHTTGAGAFKGTAVAIAVADAAINQTAIVGAGGFASNSFNNNGTLNVNAGAGALGGFIAVAVAVASGVSQHASGGWTNENHFFNGTVTNVTTAGTTKAPALIHVSANAGAVAISGIAVATAVAKGILQSAVASGGLSSTATDALVNQGIIDVTANAGADGFILGVAQAGAFGIFQGAFSASDADISLTNGLTVNGGHAVINVSANASAHGFTTTAGGHLVNAFDVAFATAAGISQDADGNGSSADADIFLLNQGTINVKAHANATALGSALAVALAPIGIRQEADDANSNTNVLVNATGATISVTANAHAFASGLSGAAGAGAIAVGIIQTATGWWTGGTQAHNALTNAKSAEINVSANAAATASFLAVAIASAAGINQFAWVGNAGATGSSATNQLHNTGNIHVAANAAASASGFGLALAVARGVRQSAFASSNTNSFAGDLLVNKGTITVEAHANASAGFFGAATAAPLWGVFQQASSADFVQAVFINGTTAGSAARLHVSGTAFAGGSFAFAKVVSEIGVNQTVNADSFTGSLALASVINHGDITVNATAVAAGGALGTALAVDQGIFQHAGHALGVVTASGIFGDTDQLFNDGKIDVSASALAFGASAQAVALDVGISQYASASTTLGWGTLARNNLTNENLITVHANASASGFLFGGKAIAIAHAGGVFQTATSAWNAVNTVVNHGTIGPFAHAWAEGWTFAFASAGATGVSQSATADGLPFSFAVNNLTNTGKILATAIATAKAGTTAVALAGAFGVTQNATSAAFANNNLINGGLINASAHASAHGAFATANAVARGVSQSATVLPFATVLGVITAGIAGDFLVNSGTINAHATAFAKGGAVSVGAFAVGINQWAGGSSIWAAGAHITNTAGASLNVAAHATGIGNARAGGVGGTPVIASATGINQGVWSTTTLGNGAPAFALGVGVTNEGVIHVEATAKATGGIWAAAFASATGIWQRAQNALVAGALVNNTGALTVLANASAKTTTDAFGAVATAFAMGISQGVVATATSGLALATVVNKGTIIVDANAHASGPFAFGFASARAVGVTQGLFGFFASEHFHNTGLFDVHAGAVGQGTTGTAIAFAQGVNVNGGVSPFLALDMVNNGTFHVEADAGNGGGPGTGVAIAGGMLATDGFASGVVFGTIANHAKMSVTANAAGASVGFASAFGIAVAANQFSPPTVLATALISNTGSLFVRAIVGSTGGSAKASGIVVSANGAPTGVGTGHIVNNSGTIYAGISFDGGASFLRGTAINTFFAPNAMQIDWMGSAHGTGHIYGNVFISTDDTITVSDGKTCFNGVINDPSLVIPNSPFPGTTLASPVGVLSIVAGGTLVMVNDPVQGPAAAYVSTYNQSGTLVLELRGQDHTLAANSLGKIVVSNSANLGGKLVVVPYAGLYTNAAYTVASAPVGGINGTWANVYVGDTAGDHSVLLHGSISNNGTVAIFNLTRTAFNAVPGLTHNEQHVGLGMEHSYSTSMTGPYADMIAKLFLEGTSGNYANDLFQLSGVEYGQHALASLASVRMLNDTVGTHLQLIASGGSDHVGQLIQGVSPAAGGTGIGKGNIWVSAYGTRGSADASPDSGSRNDYNDHGIFGGVDFDMDPQTRVGFVAGETSGQSRFKDVNDNQGNFNGWHLGMYGRYDADPWYVEGPPGHPRAQDRASASCTPAAHALAEA